MEPFRSLGAMLITAPSDTERLYEIAVRVARAEMRPLPGHALFPWITVRANIETGDVRLAAVIKVKRADP